MQFTCYIIDKNYPDVYNPTTHLALSWGKPNHLNVNISVQTRRINNILKPPTKRFYHLDLKGELLPRGWQNLKKASAHESRSWVVYFNTYKYREIMRVTTWLLMNASLKPVSTNGRKWSLVWLARALITSQEFKNVRAWVHSICQLIFNICKKRFYETGMRDYTIYIRLWFP